MKVSKNIYLGGPINDPMEIKRIAQAGGSVVVKYGYGYRVHPAAWVLHWSLQMILQFNIYYAVKDSDLTEVEFENLTE